MVTSALASTAHDALGLMSFADYQERCLYHPDHGYYASGRVAFGHDGDFWTFAQGMSPVFGWMLAEAARRLFVQLDARGRLPAHGPLTLLELGGGDGSMAVDICRYVEDQADTDAWRPWSRRIQYVLGDRSGGLRDVQSAALKPFIDSGRAQVKPLGASVGRDWEGAFHGVVISNEMMDVMPSERLRIVGPGPEARRIHLVPTNPQTDARLTVDQFWSAVENETPWALSELEVPLEAGWVEQSTVVTPPSALTAYLDSLAPLVADLAACGHLPIDVCWQRDLPTTIHDLAALLDGPDRAGAALLLDYGGTSRHLCDPNTVAHLRVYGPDRDTWHTDAVYAAPYRDDITQDIDFTELARLVRQAGMQVIAYGHQRYWERDVDLDGATARAALDAARHEMPTDKLVDRFRVSPGFQGLVFGARVDPPWTNPLAGTSDLDGRGLATLRPGVDRRDLAFALGDAGLNPGIAVALKPCGDLAADLNDRGYAGQERRVADLLERHGWLALPGDV